jgi:hypothetical protein
MLSLLQGERTAANAGIPFIVLGRRISAESIQEHLKPLLAKKRAKQPPPRDS